MSISTQDNVTRLAGALALDDAPAPVVRLRGGWLVLARVIWIAVALLAAVYCLAAVPAVFAALQRPCLEAGCPPGVLTAAMLRELEALRLAPAAFAAFHLAPTLLFVAVSLAVGLIIFRHKSDDPVVLFVALALAAFGAQSFDDALGAVAGGSALLTSLFSLVIFFSNISTILIFYVLPDGRFVPRWTAVAALLVTSMGVALFLFPQSPAGLWLRSFAGPSFAAVLASLVIAQIYRYWRASGAAQRTQTKWVVFGIALAAGMLLGMNLLFPLIEQPGVPALLLASLVENVALMCIPLSIGIAILRYRLWDIDLLISRALVYAALTAAVAGLYIVVVGTLGAMFRSGDDLLISLLATGMVAVLFQPLREWLQRGVNRLVYGERDDPYAVLSRLGQKLEATVTREALLPEIVATVAQALKLPYAAIAVDREGEAVELAAYGSPPARRGVARIPLVYQSEVVGELLLAERAPGERFSQADRRLLHDLATQIGVAAHATRLTAELQRLTADLQRSRERLIIAREEERRRLRRDLHDGLGPTLAALALSASTLSEIIPSDPAAAARIAAALEREIRSTVGDIRRLVYDLRPPALDELGLVAAIRERVLQYGVPGRSQGAAPAGLKVVVEAPANLPPLPAAVEVAAYRIVQEAVTNVIKHSGAHTCTIRLALIGSRLEVEVVDDGAGISEDRRSGVGLISMRERAAELGGSCLIERLDDTGTRVRATLPVGREQNDGAIADSDRG